MRECGMSDIDHSLMKQTDECTSCLNCISLSDLERMRGDTDMCNALRCQSIGFTSGIWLSASVESTNIKDMTVCAELCASTSAACGRDVADCGYPLLFLSNL